MDHLPLLSSGIRSIIIDLVKEDYFDSNRGFTGANRADLLEKYNAVIKNINGFFAICDYTTGQYKYVSENIKSHLGYEVTGYSSIELTHFVASIIHEKHIVFLLNILFPVVLKYFKENATAGTGTDYRFSWSAKLKNIYSKYEWYLIDTTIMDVNENGFPLSTLITCTNINQFKKGEFVYYNILKKNSDGVYKIMLEGTENNELDPYQLTPREIQIINLIGQGYLNKQIADRLFITINTVQTHRKNILKKTRCQGTAELTNFAYSRGLL
jgi:DNA-binding CsgD family transcriptional regulator